MENRKPWQLYVIIGILLLTLINIFPTIRYYTQPLHEEVSQADAEIIGENIITRVNQLEEESIEWVQSFSNLLKLSPENISLTKEDPGHIYVTFKTIHDASTFKKYLPQAGRLIPFVPSQLALSASNREREKTVVLTREIKVHIDPTDKNQLFTFYKKSENGAFTEAFIDQESTRAHALIEAIDSKNLTAQRIDQALRSNRADQSGTLLAPVADEIVKVYTAFGSDSDLTKRLFASYSLKTPARIDLLVTKLKAFQSSLEREPDLHRAQLKNIGEAISIVESERPLFSHENLPLSQTKITLESPRSLLSHPLIDSIYVDFADQTVTLDLRNDVKKIQSLNPKSEKEAYLQDQLNQILFNELARISRVSGEILTPDMGSYVINTSTLTNPQSFLSMNLDYLAEKQSAQVLLTLLTQWQTDHADLTRDLYPVTHFKTHRQLSPIEQKLGLIVYAPANDTSPLPKGFKRSSIYVIAKGIESILQKYAALSETTGQKKLEEDLQELSQILADQGFIRYPGASPWIDQQFQGDLIFELDDFYSPFVNATREIFQTKGELSHAVLDFTDKEQRLIATNKIQDEIHESLLKWKDDYQAAQVDSNSLRRFEIPAPTKNVYWDNVKLTLSKFFRGDERRVLKWGLDLSGGKTVRIGLADQNGAPVTAPEDLTQAVNELYTRINKMGVSERTIRIEGDHIILDFPGSQAFSARELIQASAMYFYVVNEQFSLQNTQLREEVNNFLQGVWNEAVVTNRKDLDSLNLIAWEHLGGSIEQTTETAPRNQFANTLRDLGLQIAHPIKDRRTSAFNDQLSAIAKMRGEDFSEWDGQSHPLLITFHNYALEGASLSNVQVGYNPTEGNTLLFEIKNHYEGKQKGSYGNPQDDFYAWTSQFSEDQIAGTPKEAYSMGSGWRMAAVLNGEVITKPALKGALRESATISGRFTQREINQLAADLKAGSLSFTPKILSEQNVSAELGKTERVRGIVAAIIGLIAVAAAMIITYRFAGVVATCAVFLNLLIMWGVLQNLDAALTLPGIAGIVLTIGMAVDANVLVFERIREEFAISGKLSSAIQSGYQKAFSAIVDSNITTIIAAIILIQFDSGPVKGFAITLIIGLVSSMITALFMTRYFFAGWVKTGKNKVLAMRQLIKETNFDFLAFAKKAITISTVIAILGLASFVSQTKTIFGMDFTGGYSLNIETVETGSDENYRALATQALLKKGVEEGEFEVRELSRPNQLRLQFSLSMDQPGRPFGDLNILETEEAYEYQSMPRLNWVIEALEAGGIKISPSNKESLHLDWSMMSGQFSSTMRNNALLALAFAMLSILVYITIRFEFKFAAAAVIALLHDVLVTLGIFSIFHQFGLPVQIDLEVIGAIMTTVGYSLNDTIVVFDRIREDMRVLKKKSFAEIANHAVNITLSRTLMTSGTTLLVLLSLVFFGGGAIFSFSLIMTIGVIVGTFSSLFIASPVMLYLHTQEEGVKKKLTA